MATVVVVESVPQLRLSVTGEFEIVSDRGI